MGREDTEYRGRSMQLRTCFAEPRKRLDRLLLHLEQRVWPFFLPFRCPGASVCDEAAGTWCTRVFGPKVLSHHNFSPVPTLYVAMSLSITTTTSRTPGSSRSHAGCQCLATNAESRRRDTGILFPDFRHFMPLLAPIDAADHQVRRTDG